MGAAPVHSDVPVPSVDDLADQVADVLDYFRYCAVTSFQVRRVLDLQLEVSEFRRHFSICSLGSAMCLGVTAGAYVLTLFAVSFSMSCGTCRASDVEFLDFCMDLLC